MEKRITFLLFITLPLCLFAQFSDDFSDGDFSNNPAWIGDTEKFIVDDGTLRLNDNAAGQAALATISTSVENTQWEFWVRLAFTPSNNNHPRIYLVSDNSDLHGALNGYYIRIGKDGGDNKRLYFYRQDGNTHTEIMQGSTNLATASNNLLRIRATRDDRGQWAFYADAAGGYLFLPQGEVFDNRHTNTSWFGIRCLYTVSNANRFYFDDFVVGEVVPDTIPPVVESVFVLNASTLQVYFNKAVNPVSARVVSQYTVDKGVGHPVVSSVDPATPNVVTLLFSQPFAANEVYHIHIEGVQDFSGNIMPAYNAPFVYVVPNRFDVVFNELMVNPTPSVGLPPHEYIELYNTTGYPINLGGWTLQHGNTTRSIPNVVVKAKGLVILVTEAAYPHFQEYGNVIAVPGLSATALTNAGTNLLLFDGQDKLISFVSYTDQWYQDPSRSNGGWSLEKIDPYNFCQGIENWKASIDSRGGTPGVPNSQLSENPDRVSPNLIRAGLENSNTIILYFDEPVNEEELATAENYYVDRGIGQAIRAEPLLPDFSSARLVFQDNLQSGIIYEVTVSSQLRDCAGNLINSRTARVGKPVAAEPFDVVINEVLSNPPERGARYIELYNRSDKIIDLANHLITSKDTVANHLTTMQVISEESYLLFPGDYIVLSNNPDAVRATFMTPRPHAYIRLAGMPRMTNANGVLVFATRNLQEIDIFAYDEGMHLVLLTTTRGVALERLNPNRPTQDWSNWHSASQGSGFGTPGYQNSQHTLQVDAEPGQITLYPEVFSPDGDGHEDLLNISYAFNQPGLVANIRIFDSRGRMVRYLSRAELLGASGVITWDGTTDAHQKAPVGIYLVHIELLDPTGKVEHHKKTTVLGGRF